MIEHKAVIETGATIGEGTTIGAGCFISRHAVIGEHNHIAAGVVIDGNTRIGNNNTIQAYTVLGTAPQDLKGYSDDAGLHIGDGNHIGSRVFITAGTNHGGLITLLGDSNNLHDGVHIGQDDGSLADARAVVGDSLIVGRSTHSPAQARAAYQEGFDYIGFGPLFPTPTKKGRPGIGLENIPSVQQEVGAHIPVFCIGGIKPENLPLVLASGARRVVIVSSLLQSENISQTTRSAHALITDHLSPHT